MTFARTHARAHSTVLVAVFSLACEHTFGSFDDTPSPVELSLFADRAEMGVDDGLEVCGASLGYVDRFIELYTDAAIAGGIDTPVEYYYLHEETVHRAGICGPSARACTRQGVVYAQSPIHTHEIVHAVRQIQHGGSPVGMPFFEEGIAQWHDLIEVGWDDSFSVQDLPGIVGQSVPADLYDPAAHLLSVIAAEQSAHIAEQLVDRSGEIEVAEDVERVAEDVLGLDLQALETMYGAYPKCSAGARSRMLVECAAEPQVWADTPESFTPYIVQAVGEFNCEDPRVIGPLEGRLWVFYTIDVAEEGAYELEVDTDQGQRLQLTSCNETCGADLDLRWDEGTRQEDIILMPGRYVIRLSREFGDERSVNFQLRGPQP